jgi:hypothetical protein
MCWMAVPAGIVNFLGSGCVWVAITMAPNAAATRTTASMAKQSKSSVFRFIGDTMARVCCFGNKNVSEKTTVFADSF